MRKYGIRELFFVGLLLLSCIGGCSAKKTYPEGGEKMVIDPERTIANAPRYLLLHKNGELRKRGDILWSMMEKCTLCPRRCGAQRLKGEKGFCGADADLIISSHHLHFGEERGLVGNGGSGTIFCSHCSLRCVFCFNWEISHLGRGEVTSISRFAEMMLRLQAAGAHNINIVTPTHYVPHLVKALDRAAAQGLRLPLVYNTSGWENLEILRLLDGVVDIYLPDFKYAESAMAAAYSAGADTYPEITKKAILEMHRQVGVARPDEEGIIHRGLMIRHLVMPNNVSGTREVLRWIAENLPRETYVNLMAQYMPAYRAREFPAIARRITDEEYFDAVRYARELGLTGIDTR